MTRPRSRPTGGSRRRDATRRARRIGTLAAAIGAAALMTVLVALLAQGSGARTPQSGRTARRSSASTQARHRHGRGRHSTAGRSDGHHGSGSGGDRRAHPIAHRHHPSPGSLPQTSALPSAHTIAFRKEMSDLWSAIVTDSPARARPAFFPKGAYLQLKEIEGAESDYINRLLYDYGLDIGAAHALLGPGARKATLLGVEVPSGYAHWVPPGVCYNGIGYFETPNSRLIYREGGRVKSFGIASMISWRGVWYVVHLGAILRSAAEGVVDAPAEGKGYAEPSSTC